MSVQSQSAYPTAAKVMRRARAYVNDAFQGGNGRILTNQAPFSVEFLNGALEDLQDAIGNNGITLIKDNVILGPLTALPGVNPATQTFVSFQGYFNGTQMVALPKLPSDCRAVLRVWEREVGSGLPFVPMTQPQEGLPSTWQGQCVGLWEWRQDRINMMGSTLNEEIRIRYESQLQEIAADSTTDDWQNTEIAILSSVNELAHFVAYFYARARGAQAAAIMQADGETYKRRIIRRYVRRDQATPYQRVPYGQDGTRSDSLSGGSGLPY